MPELPDLTVYQQAIRQRFVGQSLRQLQVANPFLLRTVVPAPSELSGAQLVDVERIGKQLVLAFTSEHFAGERFAAVHLMIAGRFQLLEPGAKIPRGRGLAAFQFDSGGLLLTEAGKKRRAALRLFDTRAALAELDRGGLEPLVISVEQLRAQLTARNQTIKRALTDQRLLAGIGNAYSDEILWAARLSPYKNTTKLSDPQWVDLHRAMRETLTAWIDRLSQQIGDAWPKKVTAFHPDMAVHGKFGQPCPTCAAPVQRIMYAEKNDANYCPGCQTEGKILADRMLSKLLKDAWPKTLEELEE